MTPMTPCTWGRSCPSPARYEATKQSRPGLILVEHVCDEHRANAERWGYRLTDVDDR